jgi:Tol biopolymer transport system component
MHGTRVGTMVVRSVVAMVAVALAGCGRAGNVVGTQALDAPARSAQPPATAQIFAPGVISDAREQWRITFTPDGKTAYFSSSNFFFPFTRQATIYVSHRVDGEWTTPEVAPFSGTYSDIDPFISPNGQRLYFSSIRPVNGVINGDIDLWMVERTADGWSEPIHLGPEVNSPTADELYPSASADGTLYFASGPFFPQPGRHYDIYSAERDGDGFAPRQALGSGVNTTPVAGGGLQDAWEFNPEISVDGKTLVFTSLRPGGYGLGDLYVSHLHQGEWSPAQNLGPAVNTAADEYHPTLSRDRRTLWFVRRAFPTPGNFYHISTSALDGF